MNAQKILLYDLVQVNFTQNSVTQQKSITFFSFLRYISLSQNVEIKIFNKFPNLESLVGKVKQNVVISEKNFKHVEKRSCNVLLEQSEQINRYVQHIQNVLYTLRKELLVF